MTFLIYFIIFVYLLYTICVPFVHNLCTFCTQFVYVSFVSVTQFIQVPKTCSTIEEKNLLPILHTPDANSCRDYRSGKCRNDVRSVQGVDGAGNQKSLLIVSLTNGMFHFN